jgi:hypothetical protein
VLVDINGLMSCPFNIEDFRGKYGVVLTNGNSRMLGDPHISDADMNAGGMANFERLPSYRESNGVRPSGRSNEQLQEIRVQSNGSLQQQPSLVDFLNGGHDSRQAGGSHARDNSGGDFFAGITDGKLIVKPLRAKLSTD